MLFSPIRPAIGFVLHILLVPVAQSSLMGKFEIIRNKNDIYTTSSRPLLGCTASAISVGNSSEKFSCKCERGTYFHSTNNTTNCLTDGQLTKYEGCKRLVKVPKIHHQSTVPTDLCVIAAACVITTASVYNTSHLDSEGVWVNKYSEIIQRIFYMKGSTITVQNNLNLRGLLIKLRMECTDSVHNKNTSCCYLYKFFGKREYPLDDKLIIMLQSLPLPKQMPPIKPPTEDTNDYLTKKTLLTVFLPILVIAFMMVFILLCLLRKKRIGFQRFSKRKNETSLTDLVPTIIIDDYDSQTQLNSKQQQQQKDVTKTFQVINNDTKRDDGTLDTSDVIENRNVGIVDEMTCKDIEDIDE